MLIFSTQLGDFFQNPRNSKFELSKMLIFSTQLAGRFFHEFQKSQKT